MYTYIYIHIYIYIYVALFLSHPKLCAKPLYLWKKCKIGNFYSDTFGLVTPQVLNCKNRGWAKKSAQTFLSLDAVFLTTVLQSAKISCLSLNFLWNVVIFNNKQLILTLWRTQSLNITYRLKNVCALFFCSPSIKSKILKGNYCISFC